jgi:hypothetical protein
MRTLCWPTGEERGRNGPFDNRRFLNKGLCRRDAKSAGLETSEFRRTEK